MLQSIYSMGSTSVPPKLSQQPQDWKLTAELCCYLLVFLLGEEGTPSSKSIWENPLTQLLGSRPGRPGCRQRGLQRKCFHWLSKLIRPLCLAKASPRVSGKCSCRASLHPGKLSLKRSEISCEGPWYFAEFTLCRSLW